MYFVPTSGLQPAAEQAAHPSDLYFKEDQGHQGRPHRRRRHDR
jgi:hypothetical protein